MATKSSCLACYVSQENLELFSEWYHGTMYELLKFDSAWDDSKWIAIRLKPRVTPTKVSESSRLSQRLKLIGYDERRGRYVTPKNRISTGSEIRGMVYSTYNHLMLNLASRSLSEQSGSERYVSAVTISVGAEKIIQIKGATTEFRKKLLEISEDNADLNEHVLQVNIQIFPLVEVPRKRSFSV